MIRYVFNIPIVVKLTKPNITNQKMKCFGKSDVYKNK